MSNQRTALVLQRPVTTSAVRDDSGVITTRDFLFPDMFARVYDGSAVPPAQNPLQAKLPTWLRLAQEVRARSAEYDAVVSWGERMTIALMALDATSRTSKPHIAMLSRYSTPNVRIPLKLFGRALHSSITWGEVQRNYAIDRMGIPPEKIYLIKHFVDEVFWDSAKCGPAQGDGDTISSAGAENRDYQTLIEALAGLPIPCHITTDHVRIDRLPRAKRIAAADLMTNATPNITMSPKNRLDLRALYGRSRFIVIPLMPSNVDNGVTVLLEAMSMGKAVICSGIEGQIGVLEDGVTGLYVPPRDPRALRRAIEQLWADPARAARMGRAGREYVEKHHTLQQFCTSVKRCVESSLNGGHAARDGSIAE